MRYADVTIKGVSPLGFNRRVKVEKKDKENHDDYERRTWRERMHYDEKGFVFIPPMAFKKCIENAAKYLSIQIPGKGKATYTKHFLSGIMVLDCMKLDVKKDDVPSEELDVPADGQSGGKKRVTKFFPRIDQWGGTFRVYILDNTITDSILQQVIEESGKFIGLLFFRPQNGGFWGRFILEDIEFGEE